MGIYLKFLWPQRSYRIDARRLRLARLVIDSSPATKSEAGVDIDIEANVLQEDTCVPLCSGT